MIPDLRMIGAGAAVVVLLAATGGAYWKGRSDMAVHYETRLRAAENEALKAAREIEHTKTAEAQKVSENYEAKLKAVNDRYSAADRELGRLRVKVRACADMPAASAPAGKPDATARDGAVGAGPGEINLDGTARRIIELGRDLDACTAQVIGLQDVVREVYAVPATGGQ